MEIEKVIRILIIFLAIGALATFIATPMIFPDSTSSFRLLGIPVGLCLWLAWRDTEKKTDKHINE